MTNPDYKIEEYYDNNLLKVRFSIIALGQWTGYAVEQRFDTLDEAKEVVRMLRKYKSRVFHYVEVDE